MKTNKLSIVALTGLSAIMLFSCKKEEVNTPTSSSEAAKATISGTAYAELNETTAGLEFAPDGTKVIATTTEAGKDYNYTGTITGGKYSISIPVGRDSKVYTIAFDGFSAKAIISDKSEKVKSYTQANQTRTLTATQNTVLDVTYTPNDQNVNVISQNIIIKGKATYLSSSIALTVAPFGNSLTYSNVPEGTKIYLTNTENNEIYVATVTGGLYEFMISTKSTKNLSYKITSDSFKANETINANTKEYSYNYSAGSLALPLTYAAGTINTLADIVFLKY
jgi:hypothetical protein